MVSAGGFADGSDMWEYDFASSGGEVAGPALRLLTNSTVVSGSVVLEGAGHFQNTSVLETSNADFTSNLGAYNVAIASGSLSLATASLALTLSSANSFGNSTLTNLVANVTSLELASGTSGSFLTANITAPGTGWGALSVEAVVPPGASLSVDVLRPDLGLILASPSIGGTLDLDGLTYPLIRLLVQFDAPSMAQSPQLRRVVIGQQTNEYFVGDGVARTFTNTAAMSNGSHTITGNLTAFQRNAVNPVLQTQASTFYSRHAGWTTIIKVGSQWWMYFAASNSSGQPASIGRAVSSDLQSWTVSPSSPVLLATPAAWDASSVSEPFVMADPSGSGYVMYYSNENINSASASSAIGQATSPDGINWTKYGGNPVLARSSSGWDRGWVSEPTAVIYDNGTWTMWYSGASTLPGGSSRAIGAATSTDGRNWTRYGSSAVLSGGTACDMNDVARGSIIKAEGRFYLFYTAHDGSRWNICAASSADGFSWTKMGSVLSGNPGWETDGPLLPTVVDDGGRYVMIYTAGSLYQIGRANSHWRPGTIEGIVDFGARVPVSLTSLTRDALVPAGSTLMAYVRSSNNGVSWTAWENLTGSTAIQTTPARRYVMWQLTANATLGPSRPYVRGVTLGYSGYYLEGDYVSSVFPQALPILEATVNVSLGDPAYPATVMVSNDGGNNYEPATPGVPVAFPGAGSQFAYALHFAAAYNRSPVVNAVSVNLRLGSLPSDVQLRFEGDSTLIANITGDFVGTFNVTLPAGALNAAIAAARGILPVPTFTDLGLRVASATVGIVRVREARLSYELKNPLSASFSPAASDIAILEDQSRVFSVSVSSYPPQVKVNISWALDGTGLPGVADQGSFTYFTDFDSAGVHTLVCTVENGDFNYAQTWTITVQNLNRAPVIDSATPVGGVGLDTAAAQTFSVAAADPDGDSLTYTWSFDGNAQAASSTTYTTAAGAAAGAHSVSVSVSDGLGGSATSSWTFTVPSPNRAPTISAQQPAAGVGQDTRASQTFTVTASDADGDALTFAWTLDGAAQSSTTSSMTTPNGLAEGAHTVTVRVTDPEGLFAVGTWTFTTPAAPVNRAPTIASAVPAGLTGENTRAAQTFTLAATDPDGDVITHRWILDGIVQSGNASSFTTPGDLAEGQHTVAVQVSDAAGGNASRSWTFTTPAPPPTTTQPGFPIELALIAIAAGAVVLRARRRRGP